MPERNKTPWLGYPEHLHAETCFAQPVRILAVAVPFHGMSSSLLPGSGFAPLVRVASLEHICHLRRRGWLVIIGRDVAGTRSYNACSLEVGSSWVLPVWTEHGLGNADHGMLSWRFSGVLNGQNACTLYSDLSCQSRAGARHACNAVIPMYRRRCCQTC